MSRTYRNNVVRVFRGHFNEYAEILPVVPDGKIAYRCHCGYCISGWLHRDRKSLTFIPETEELESRIKNSLELSSSRLVRKMKEWN